MNTDRIIVGIDEVGRGSLAGPVAVCAVSLHGLSDTFLEDLLRECRLAALRDSKKLTRLQRERICAYAQPLVKWSVGMAEAEEIDAVGLTEAIRRASGRAIDGLGVKVDAIQADAGLRHPYEASIATEWIIKGDEKIPTISIASSIAKVTRDALMADLERIYPGYGFAKNVGYGTAGHLQGLRDLGPSDQHRRLFLRKFT